MGHFVLVNPFLSVDGNDITGHVRRVECNYGVNLEDDTSSGDDTQKNIGGLKNWDMSVEVAQDQVSGGTYSMILGTLFPLVGTSVAIVLRAQTAAVSVSNAQLSGVGVLSDMGDPIGGEVGKLAKTDLKIAARGTLSRTTS